MQIEPRSALILEDHPEACQWLSSALKLSFPEIQLTVATNLQQAFQFFEENRIGDQPFNLALIDLHLPDGSGLDIIHHLRNYMPDCVRIVATSFSDEQHIFSALQMGAQGYVLKEGRQTDIARMLIDMMDGKPPLSPAVARKILNHFQPPLANKDDTGETGSKAIDVTPQKQPADAKRTFEPVRMLSESARQFPEPGALEKEQNLTPRQIEVLGLISRGYKTQEAARLLQLSVHTVHGYIKDIYRELGINSRAEATLAASRMGLISQHCQ